MASAKIEINAEPAGADAAAFVARFLRGARGDVARREIAEARIFALEIIIALGFGNLARRPLVASSLLRHPNAAVVAQRLATSA